MLVLIPHALLASCAGVTQIFSWPLISVLSTWSLALLPKSFSLIAQLTTVLIYIPPVLVFFTSAHRFSRICSSHSTVCSYLIFIFSLIFFLFLSSVLTTFGLFPFLNHILSSPSSSSAWNILPLTFCYWYFPLILAQISPSDPLAEKHPALPECYLCLFLCEALANFSCNSSAFHFSSFSGSNSTADCRVVKVQMS